MNKRQVTSFFLSLRQAITIDVIKQIAFYISKIDSEHSCWQLFHSSTFLFIFFSDMYILHEQNKITR